MSELDKLRNKYVKSQSTTSELYKLRSKYVKAEPTETPSAYAVAKEMPSELANSGKAKSQQSGYIALGQDKSDEEYNDYLEKLIKGQKLTNSLANSGKAKSQQSEYTSLGLADTENEYSAKGGKYYSPSDFETMDDYIVWRSSVRSKKDIEDDINALNESYKFIDSDGVKNLSKAKEDYDSKLALLNEELGYSNYFDYDNRMSSAKDYTSNKTDEDYKAMYGDEYEANKAFIEAIKSGKTLDEVYANMDEKTKQYLNYVDPNFAGIFAMGREASKENENYAKYALTDDERKYLTKLIDEGSLNKALNYYGELAKNAYGENAPLYGRIAEKLATTRDNGEKVTSGLWTGATNFVQGADKFVKYLGGKEATEETLNDYVGQYTKKELADDKFASFLYDITTNVGQNAIPAVVGLIAAPLASSLAASGIISQSVATALGAGVSSGLFGASIYGNTYNEAIKQGYDKKQASLYATLNTASEVALERLIGGIPGISKFASGDFLTGLAAKTSNVFARIALSLGGSALGEFVEESSQDIIDVALRNAILGENGEVDFESALYSGLIGAISSLGMSAPTSIATSVTSPKYFAGIETYTEYKERLAENLKKYANDENKFAEMIEESIAFQAQNFHEETIAEINSTQGTDTTSQNAEIKANGNEATNDTTANKVANTSSKTAITSLADKYAENGKTAMIENYNGEDAYEYAVAFNDYYEAGRTGRTFTPNDTLTDAQAEAAYKAGVADAKVNNSNTEKLQNVNNAEVKAEDNVVGNAEYLSGVKLAEGKTADDYGYATVSLDTNGEAIVTPYMNDKLAEKRVAESDGKSVLVKLTDEGSIDSAVKELRGENIYEDKVGYNTERSRSVRNISLDTRGESRGVQKDTVANDTGETRGDLQNLSDGTREKVKSDTLFKEGKGDEVEVSYETSGDRAKLLKKNGVKKCVSFFGEIATKSGVAIRGYLNGETGEIGTQADNEFIAQIDLDRHEIMERMIMLGKVKADDVISLAEKYVEADKIKEVIDFYARHLGNNTEEVTAETLADATKELVCDGADHINQLKEYVENGWVADDIKRMYRLMDEVLDGINKANREITNGAFDLTEADTLDEDGVVDDTANESETNTEYSRRLTLAPSEARRYKDEKLTTYQDEWMTGKTANNKAEAKPLSVLLGEMSSEFGVNVTTGHVRGKGVLGFYYPGNKGIRIRNVNELPVACHEIGHALADRDGALKNVPTEAVKQLHEALGVRRGVYDEWKWTSEGYAELVRQYMLNRDVTAGLYPDATVFMLNSLSEKDRLLLDKYSDIVNATIADTGKGGESAVRLAEEGAKDLRPISERIAYLAEKLEVDWTDTNAPIKRVSSYGYKLAVNSAYQSDIIAYQLKDYITAADDAHIVGVGLRTRLTRHGINIGKKSVYKEVGEYLSYRRGLEYVKDGLQYFGDPKKDNAKYMRSRIAELEAKYPNIKALADDVHDYIKTVNEEWLVKTGLISKATFDSWTENYPDYVPIKRLAAKESGGSTATNAKKGYANQTDPYKARRGGAGDIQNPLDTIIANTCNAVKLGINNNVMRQITNDATANHVNALLMEKVETPMKANTVDISKVKENMILGIAEKLGDKNMDILKNIDEVFDTFGDYIKQYSQGKACGDVVTVMKNGKAEYWKINDANLLASITNMSPSYRNAIVRLFGGVTRFMTSNITGSNILWTIGSNGPKDIQTWITYFKNKKDLVKGFKGFADNYINAFKEATNKEVSNYYREYLSLGGSSASEYNAGRDSAKKARNLVSGTKSFNPFDAIETIGSIVEAGPRFATYQVCRENGMNPQEAFYEAMESTVNFAKAGRYSRLVGQFVPFFNAQMQGTSRLVRYFTAEDFKGKAERKKVVVGRASAYITAMIASGIIQYAITHASDDDEEDYETLSSYTKNNYWCIPLGNGKYLTFPKGREIGVGQAFVTNLLSATFGKDDKAFDEYYEYFVDSLLPSIVSDIAEMPTSIADKGVSEGLRDTVFGALGNVGALGVGVNYLTNQDFLGKAIEREYGEAKTRYNDSTSKIAYWIGQAFNVSPQMVDYVGGQILGGKWEVMQALTPMNADRTDFTFGYKNKYVKDNLYSTDAVNWVYDYQDKAEVKKDNGIDEKIDYAMVSKMTSFYSRYSSAAKAITEDEDVARSTRENVIEMMQEFRTEMESESKTAAQVLVTTIAKKADDTSLLPSVMNNYIKDGNGNEIALSASDYYQYQTSYNAYYYSYAEKNILTTMSESEQIEELKRAKNYAAISAKEEMVKKLGIDMKNNSTYQHDVSEKNNANKLTSDRNEVKSSSIYAKADDDDREFAENILKEYYRGTNYTDKIDGGKDIGLTPTEYALYRLALRMSDEDGNGSYSKSEKDKAIKLLTESITLSKDEIKYLKK